MLTFQDNFLFERAQCYISFGPLLPGWETGEQPVPVHVSTVPKNDPIHWVSLTLKSLKEDSLPHDLCHEHSRVTSKLCQLFSNLHCIEPLINSFIISVHTKKNYVSFGTEILQISSNSVRPKIYKPRAAGRKSPKHIINTKFKKEYSDDRLPSRWIEYNLTVRHSYILFVLLVCCFFRLLSGLSKIIYLGHRGTNIFLF